MLSAVYEKEQHFVVRHLTAEHYFLQPVSKTFHGRDIFAAVAGWLSKNWQPASMGEEIADFKRFLCRFERIIGNWREQGQRVKNAGNRSRHASAAG